MARRTAFALALALALPGTVCAADVAGQVQNDLRPRSLRERAMRRAGAGGLLAVVDVDGALWTGTKRLHRVAELGSVPTDIVVVEDTVVAWWQERRGLWTRTRLGAWSASGTRLRDDVVDAPVLGETAIGAHLALALPGELLLVPVKGGDIRSVPLPFARPVGVRRVEGGLAISRPSGAPLLLGPRGCPLNPLAPLRPDADPMARVRRWYFDHACGSQAPLPEEVLRLAEAERMAAVRRAVEAGDTVALAAMGVRGKAAVEALRPKKQPDEGRFVARADRIARVAPALLGATGAVVLLEPDAHMNLEPWVEGPLAPACTARVVLAPKSPATLAALRAARADLLRRGADCANRLEVVDRSQVGEAEWPVLYVAPSGSLLGTRDGAISPLTARLDIARVLVSDDPLAPLARLPDLQPLWQVGSGPGREVVLDIDGGWIAASGWDVIRGTPRGQRIVRVSLDGPVSALTLQPDGRVRVVAGGQRAVVDLDARKVTWGSPAAPDEIAPPPRRADSGAWSIRDGMVVRPGWRGRTAVRVALPVTPRAVAAMPAGAVVQTDLGLLGLDADGRLVWRLVGARAWRITNGVLVAATPRGIGGYSLPTSWSPEASPDTSPQPTRR